MARTLRDAEIAFLLEPLPSVRGVYVLDPPTSEFDYVAFLDRRGGAELSEAHFRLMSGVGRERAARVWLALNDHFSAPRALERAVRVELDPNERELAARSIEARREKLEDERRLHFRQILAETIAWCRSRAAEAQRLRTPELRPSPIVGGERDPRFRPASIECMRAVAELAAHRARLLREHGLVPDVSATEATGGGLLLWRSSWRDIDPGSPTGRVRCEISDEFFDTCDCPPWDTWVTWEPRVQGAEALVSWVPHKWRLRAEAACQALGRPGVEWLREPFPGRRTC